MTTPRPKCRAKYEPQAHPDSTHTCDRRAHDARTPHHCPVCGSDWTFRNGVTPPTPEATR